MIYSKYVVEVIFSERTSEEHSSEVPGESIMKHKLQDDSVIDFPYEKPTEELPGCLCRIITFLISSEESNTDGDL